MDSNERVNTFVRSVIDANLRSVPRQHPGRTESCLRLGLLVEVAEQDIDSALAVHAAGCAYCRTTLRTALADNEDVRNEWVCAEAAVDAARPNRVRSRRDEMLSVRGAHAFLAARSELGSYPLPQEVRDRLETVATGLARVLFDRDHAAADGLLSVAHALRSAPRAVRGEGGEGAFEFHEIMTSLVLGWANERDASEDLTDLRIARELFLTVGERSRAASCSSRAAAILYLDGSHEEATIEYARAVLDADDGRALADALAAVGRISVRLANTALAVASLTAAEEVYRAIGDSPAVENILAERMSLIPAAEQSPPRRRALTKADG